MKTHHWPICRSIPLLLTLILTGCSSQPSPTGGAEFRQRPQEYSFKVSGTLAEAGITFHLSRAFEVGPATNGQVHSSRISTTELSQLQSAWTSYKKTAFTQPESCQDWTLPESPWKEALMKIEVLENGRSIMALRSDSGRLCGAGESQALRQFAETLLTLGRARYPKTFPSECLALQDEFATESELTKSCTSDLECSHVDPQFEAIPVGQIQYVALKSCSAVPVLSTANTELLEGSRRKLLRLRESIRQVCQPTGLASGCSAADEIGFQNDRHPAQCVSGACSSGLE